MKYLSPVELAQWQEKYTLAAPRDSLSQQWISDRPTLVDIAAINAGGGLARLIDETVSAFPEVTQFPMMPINGITYKQLVLLERGTVAFRNANDGVDGKKSTYAPRAFGCHILDARWEVDKMIADSGEYGTAEQLIAQEADNMLTSAFETAGSQFWYGTAASAIGFAGMIQVYDLDGMTVVGTGTTAEELSSVFAVRRNGDNISFLLGGAGDLGSPDIIEETVLGENNKPLKAYTGQLTAHLGMKVDNKKHIARATQLTTQSGKGFSDEVAMKLINKFPTNQPPTQFWLNKTQREELRKSRITALLPSPPMPTEAHGIPLMVTDAIIDGETDYAVV